MIKTLSLMNWHLKHNQMIKMSSESDALDKASISAFEYTESDFIDLQTILSFISKKIAAFIIEYESARGFVDRFKVSSRSNT
jgi:hypothetical protein